jgi:hypothetical protein
LVPFYEYQFLSDSTIARSNAFCVTSNQQEQTNFEPTHHDGSGVRSSGAAQPSHPLHLRDALEWLLGSQPHPEDALSHEEKTARQTRRTDLLIWLLNLEPRLAPYGEY